MAQAVTCAAAEGPAPFDGSRASCCLCPTQVPRQGSVDGSFTTTSRTSSVVACPRNTHLFFVTVRREQGRERGGSMERGRSVPESSTPGLDLQGRQSEGAEGEATKGLGRGGCRAGSCWGR